jgi:autotransporter-associated beta strand protein
MKKYMNHTFYNQSCERPRLLIVLALCASVLTSRADRYWDGAGGSTGGVGAAGGGSGIWNTTNTNWDSLSTNGADITWNGPDNIQHAVFGGVGGTVTMGGSFNNTTAGTADQRPQNFEILSSGYTFDANNFFTILGGAGISTSLTSGQVLNLTNSTNAPVTNILGRTSAGDIAAADHFLSIGNPAGTPTANGAKALTASHSIRVEGTVVRDLNQGYGAAQIVLTGGSGTDPTGWVWAMGNLATVNYVSRTMTVSDNAVVQLNVQRSGPSGSNAHAIQPGALNIGANAQVVFGSVGGYRLSLTGTTTIANGAMLNFHANGNGGNSTILHNVVLNGDATLGTYNNGGNVARVVSLSLGGNKVTVGGIAGILNITDATGVVANDTVDRVTGTGSIQKVGASTLRINGQSTFTGGLVLEAGGLQLDNSSLGLPNAPTSGPLGTGTLTLGGAANPRIVATTGPVQTLHNAVTVAGSFTVGPANGAFTHPVAFAGDATLTASPVITTAVAGTFSGAIGDGGNAFGLTKAGSALLTLSGDSTYTGSTTISAGTLQLGSGGTTGSLATSGISIATGATLSTVRDGTLTLSAPITGAGSLTVNNVSSGTTVLSNATNAYTGATTITTGALQVGSGGTGKTGTGNVTAQSGSAILGTGAVQGGSFIAQSGSNVFAGDSTSDSSYGTLSFTPVTPGGSFDFQSGSTTWLGINPGGTSDQLLFAGDGSQSLLFNGDLVISPISFTPTAAETFQLLSWLGLSSATFGSRYLASSYGGLLLGNGDDNLGFDLPNVSGSGYAWDISAFTTSGSISLVLVPEPSRALLLFSGLASLLLLRRRGPGSSSSIPPTPVFPALSYADYPHLVTKDA